MLINGGELHHDVAIRMPDRKVYKVHHDGTEEELYELSDPDNRVYYEQKDVK